MVNKNESLDHIFEKTKIILSPKQTLATFGITNIYYYLTSQILDKPNKIRVREGNVKAERPRIIPYGGLKDMFEGFGKTGKDFEEIFKEKYSDKLRILEYKFENKYIKSQTFTGNIDNVTSLIAKDIESKNRPLTTIIKGIDDYWQVSLMKFIVDVASKAFYSNITELEERGFFKDSQRANFAKREIENLFKLVKNDKTRIKELGDKLVQYGLFEDYQDRFFELIKK